MERRFARRAVGYVLSAAVAVLSTTSLHAVTNWQGATGDWFNAGNWTNGVPTVGGDTVAIVNNGGTAQITSATGQASDLYLGVAEYTTASGTVTVTNGALNVGVFLPVGWATSAAAQPAAGAGTITLTNSNLTAPSFYLGLASATSTAANASASLTATGNIALGETVIGDASGKTGGVGTVTSATFSQTSGNLSLTSLTLARSRTDVGGTANATASLTFSGGGTFTGSGDAVVGQVLSGTSSFMTSNATGDVSINAGTSSSWAPSSLIVGQASLSPLAASAVAHGTVNYTGGSFGSTFSILIGDANGANGSSGTVTVATVNLNVDAATWNGPVIVGRARGVGFGAGTVQSSDFNITAATSLTATGNLTVGDSQASGAAPTTVDAGFTFSGGGAFNLTSTAVLIGNASSTNGGGLGKVTRAHVAVTDSGAGTWTIGNYTQSKAAGDQNSSPAQTTSDVSFTNGTFAVSGQASLGTASGDFNTDATVNDATLTFSNATASFAGLMRIGAASSAHGADTLVTNAQLTHTGGSLSLGALALGTATNDGGATATASAGLSSTSSHFTLAGNLDVGLAIVSNFGGAATVNRAELTVSADDTSFINAPLLRLAVADTTNLANGGGPATARGTISFTGGSFLANASIGNVATTTAANASVASASLTLSLSDAATFTGLTLGKAVAAPLSTATVTSATVTQTAGDLHIANLDVASVGADYLATATTTASLSFSGSGAASLTGNVRIGNATTVSIGTAQVLAATVTINSAGVSGGSEATLSSLQIAYANAAPNPGVSSGGTVTTRGILDFAGKTFSVSGSAIVGNAVSGPSHSATVANALLSLAGTDTTFATTLSVGSITARYGPATVTAARFEQTGGTLALNGLQVGCINSEEGTSATVTDASAHVENALITATGNIAIGSTIPGMFPGFDTIAAANVELLGTAGSTYSGGTVDVGFARATNSGGSQTTAGSLTFTGTSFVATGYVNVGSATGTGAPTNVANVTAAQTTVTAGLFQSLAVNVGTAKIYGAASAHVTAASFTFDGPQFHTGTLYIGTLDQQASMGTGNAKGTATLKNVSDGTAAIVGVGSYYLSLFNEDSAANTSYGELHLIDTTLNVSGFVEVDAVHKGDPAFTVNGAASGLLHLQRSHLTAQSALYLGDGATLQFDINGLTRGSLYGAIDVLGPTTLAGDSVIDFLDSPDAPGTYTYYLIAFAPSVTPTGAFSSELVTNLDPAFTVDFLGLATGNVDGSDLLTYQLRISSDDVAPIPEPTTASLLITPLLFALTRRRRSSAG